MAASLTLHFVDDGRQKGAGFSKYFSRDFPPNDPVLMESDLLIALLSAAQQAI